MAATLAKCLMLEEILEEFDEGETDDDEGRFVQDQHAKLDFYGATILKRQSADRRVAPLGTHYSDSEPTSLCSFLLRA